MDNIDSIVKKVIGNLSSKAPTQIQQIQKIWEDIKEKERIKHADVIGFYEGTVQVATDSSARKYQLQLIKTKILKAFQKQISDIKNVSFRIGKGYE